MAAVPAGGASYLMAVDVGNTNVSIGAFRDRVLVASWRIATERGKLADEYVPFLIQLFQSADIAFAGLEAVVISSVVPPVVSRSARHL